MAREKRVVYSSGSGRMCPTCGWPAGDCRCSATLAADHAAVPEKVTAILRVENRASGKHVTVVGGLPDNRGYLEDLARDLKKACGTGGAIEAGAIELQGDQRERLRELLAKRGMKVRG